jgi:FixJ family two-component response regulator
MVERMRAKWARRRQRGVQLRAPKSRVVEVDEIAIERAMHGDPVRLTCRERGLVVQTLTERRLSARAIAARLGVSERTVERYRAGQVRAAL